MATISKNITIKGLPQFRKALGRYPQISKPIFNKAIERGIKEIEVQTVPRTPIDTGALRRSITQSKTFSNLRGEIQPGKSGKPRDYAVIQHENMGFKHPRGGEAKYLEKGVNAAVPKIDKLFQEGLKKTLNIIAKASKV